MSETTETKSYPVTIEGKVFQVPHRFSAGHVLTEGEAAQMQQVFKENLRNNIATVMKKRADATPPGAEYTQEEFTAYANAYEFGVRGSGEARDPVATEERKLARQTLTKALKDNGKKIADLSDATREAALDKLVASGNFRADAEEIVAKRAAVQSIDLGDLLGEEGEATSEAA